MDEAAFQRWYQEQARRWDLNPDPDAPGQFYDYRGAFRAGAQPDDTGHWPSDFKLEGHPALVVGGFDVRTGARVPGQRQASEAELIELGWDPATARALSRGEGMAPQRTPQSDEISLSMGDVDPELAAILRELGGTVEDEPASARPNDPQTGRPVRVPGDPGFVPFGDEPSAEGARPGALRLILNAAGGAASTLNPMNVLSALEAVSTPEATGRTLESLYDAQVGEGRKALELFRNSDVRTPAGRYNMVEGVGRGLASILPIVGPAAARMGEEIGSGDPDRMSTAAGEAIATMAAPAAARAATSRVSPMLRRGAESVAGKTMRAGDDVLAMTDTPIVDEASRAAARSQLARTALDEGVTPGVIRGSTARPRARMSELQSEATRVLDGPSGTAPVSPRRIVGQSQRTLMDRLQNQMAPEEAVEAARGAAREATGHVRLTQPTARNLNRMASGNIDMVRGTRGPRADASRALARDARREISRAAPDSAPTMDRISRLEPVMEAYERAPSTPLEIPGLPTIDARILLSGVNRLLGPTARGLNAASKVSPAAASNATRMAVLSSLLEGNISAPR